MPSFKPAKAQYEKEYQSVESSFHYGHREVRRCNRQYHFHAEYEIILFLEADGWSVIGNAISPLQRDELLLLPPHLSHGWYSPPTSRRVSASFLQFLPAILGERFLGLPGMSAVKQLIKRSGRGLIFSRATALHVKGLLASWTHRDAGMQLLGLLEILLELSRDRTAKPICNLDFRTPSPTGHEAELNEMYEHLNAHYGEPVRQAKLAKNLRLHPSAFSRLVKRGTGKRFVDILNEIRIGQACRLLMESDKMISEICYACGYENLSHFNRQFRRIKKQSPGEFRQSLPQGPSMPGKKAS